MAIKFDNSAMEQVRRNPDQNNHFRKAIPISLERLKPFPNHPFKLYEGQQLEDLIRSIQDDKLLFPILVRKIDDENYEILSGHNRVKAAKELGWDTIPAIICVTESDEDAWRIVVDTNFNQRSKKDMKPSELADALYMLNEVMKKKPGYRSDVHESEDGSQSDNRSRTICVIGKMHGLSQATIARYIRVAQLSKALQECLDNKLIGLGVAERLSYLQPNEQDIVQKLLQENVKIDTQQAQELKKQSFDHELGEDEIRQITTPKVLTTKRRAIKFREDLFTKYFSEDQSTEEIEDTIAKALELLRSQAPF